MDYIEQLPLPALGKDQILVKIHAASLNYRDLMINKVNNFIFCSFVQEIYPVRLNNSTDYWIHLLREAQEWYWARKT